MHDFANPQQHDDPLLEDVQAKYWTLNCKIEDFVKH